MEQKKQFNVNIKKPQPKLNKTVVAFVVVLILIFIGAIASSIYFYKKSTFDPNVDASKQLAEYTKKVGKHIVLPEGEVPTMATVSDPEKLKDQPFFANSKKGDVVLIFSNSRKAILYDPVNDRIVEVAPINATQGAPQTN